MGDSLPEARNEIRMVIYRRNKYIHKGVASRCKALPSAINLQIACIIGQESFNDQQVGCGVLVPERVRFDCHAYFETPCFLVLYYL